MKNRKFHGKAKYFVCGNLKSNILNVDKTNSAKYQPQNKTQLIDSYKSNAQKGSIKKTENTRKYLQNRN